jgi:hypothetical protein
MSGQIFISYRHEESQWSARSLHDRLCRDFDPKQIFMDIDAIALGEDFVEAIETTVAKCDVLIAVIGKNWLTSKDDQGKRRLDNPEDFVRMEIGAALKRKIRVIPVLVDGALMPRSADLPEDLKPLVRRQALQITGVGFEGDCQRLAATIRLVLEKTPTDKAAEELWRRQSRRTPQYERILEIADLARTEPRAAIKESWLLLAKTILRAANVSGDNLQPNSPEISASLKRLEANVETSDRMIGSVKNLQAIAMKVFYHSEWAYSPGQNEAEDYVFNTAVARAGLGERGLTLDSFSHDRHGLAARPNHLARIARRKMGRHGGRPSHEIGKANINAANTDGPLGDRTLPPPHHGVISCCSISEAIPVPGCV